MISYIALGSNLDHPCQQLHTALHSIAQLPQVCLITHSSFYRSKPVDVIGQQPDFINAVACIDTTLTPQALLHTLLAVEAQQGRVRVPGEQGHARTLDIDVLLYGTQTLHEADLIIPHPRLQQRAFVLYPLAEIAPQLRLPNGQSLSQLLLHCAYDGLERLTEDAEQEDLV